MGVNLHAVFKTNLTGNETETDWQKYCDVINNSGRFEEFYYPLNWDSMEWEFEIDPFNVDLSGNKLVHFNGPHSMSFMVYPGIGYLDTGRSFKHLYGFGSQSYDKDSHLWKMRKDIFDLISLFGGTEIIYVADERYPKITYFDQIYEGMSYEAIKAELIQTLGAPVTDYRDLSFDIYTPLDIKEFFLDDFSDIKKEYLPLFSTVQNLKIISHEKESIMNLSEESLKLIAKFVYLEYAYLLGEQLYDFLFNLIGFHQLHNKDYSVVAQEYFLKKLILKNGTLAIQRFLIQYFSPLKFQDRMPELDQYIATLNPLFREEGWFIVREGNTLNIHICF